MKNLSESGKRLKLLRNMMGFSVIELANEFQISSKVIFTWEQELFGGLTLGSAKNLIKMAKERGVICDLNWLVEGTGRMPYFIENKDIVPQDDVDEGVNLRELQQEMMRILRAWQDNKTQEPIEVQLNRNKIGYFMPTTTFAEYCNLCNQLEQQQKKKSEENE